MKLYNAGDQAGSDTAFATADKLKGILDKDNAELAGALRTSQISLTDYIADHFNDTYTLGGLNAKGIDDKGQADITNGTAKIAPILGKAFDNFSAAIHAAAPANLFGDLGKETEALRARFSKLLGAANSSEPKEKEIPNPFHEGPMQIPQQMAKAVADSFAQIGAGGRVSNSQHYDPMVEQQKITNDKLDELIGQGEETDDAPPTGGWNSVQ